MTAKRLAYWKRLTGVPSQRSQPAGSIMAYMGTNAPAGQKIDGGPSVLYDAVILLASKHGAAALAVQPVVRDFVADAYAHCKFIGYTGDASPLFEAAGLAGQS